MTNLNATSKMKDAATHTGSDTSLGLLNAKDNKKSNGNEQLIEYHAVKDTPFTVARNGTDWFVLMGKYRFTQNLGSRKNAERNARSMTWDRIMQVIQVMITDNENEKQLKQLNDTINRQAAEREAENQANSNINQEGN